MSLSRRRFTPEFKLSAVERLEQGASAAEVSRAFEVNPNLLHRWRREFRQGPANAFPGEGKRRWEETRTAELERKVGQQNHGDRFFKGVLAAHRTTAEAAGIGWKAAVGQQILQQVREKPPMTIQRMCRLTELSRATFYRLPPHKQRPDPDLELRDAIQRIAVEFPSYGRPRITAELQRRGWVINPKKVYRILREDNLLCLRRRKFVLTTDSGHGLRVYPNLVRETVLSGLDQLWVADITYIRLVWEFVYLAVILDAYSRRVVGWALEDTLEGKLTIAALRMALDQRRPAAGLVHHSDRGVQYAANGYVELLKQHGITPSMSRKANPYDNAKAESFMKTLKYEEVYRSEYRDLAEARASIGRFLEQVYNESACIRRWAIVRRWSSSRTWTPNRRFRRQQREKFSEAWGNLSIR